MRLAFDGSVACTRPPVRFQTSQLSTVPNASSPRRARSRAAGTWSSSHLSLVPEKYASSTSPVLRRNVGAWPAARSASQAPAVRRSCQTIACASGRPVARSQRTVVSRWFVMPIAAISRAAMPAFAIASCMTPDCVAQISTASCSTQPPCGKICRNSCCAVARTAPVGSKTIARELVVPWSRART